MLQDEVDILVRSSISELIIMNLIDSGEWEPCINPAIEKPLADTSKIDATPIADTWLRSGIRDPWFHYLLV